MYCVLPVSIVVSIVCLSSVCRASASITIFCLPFCVGRVLLYIYLPSFKSTKYMNAMNEMTEMTETNEINEMNDIRRVNQINQMKGVIKVIEIRWSTSLCIKTLGFDLKFDLM